MNCDLIEPEMVREPDEEEGFILVERWPGAVPELVNDGVDNCAVCTKRGGDHAYHGHVPVRWIRVSMTHGRAWYHCDACGHDWMCSWGLRKETA